MRYMFIVKTDAENISGGPTPELMQAMHDLATREIAAGRMVADGGLAPRNDGSEIRLRRGKLDLLDGPFTESKEIIGGFAIFDLPDRDAALESGRRFMQLHVDHMPGWEGTLEIRELVGSMVAMIKGGEAG